MNKICFITNRQSGKSKIVAYEALKDIDNTLIITPSLVFKEVYSRLDVKLNIKPISIVNQLNGIKATRIIIEEYFHLSVKDRIKLYELIHNSYSIQELIIVATPKYQYPIELRDLIVSCKRSKRNMYDPILKNWIDVHSRGHRDLIENNTRMVEDLWYNFTTDPDTKLIANNFFNNDYVYNHSREYGLRNDNPEITGILWLD